MTILPLWGMNIRKIDNVAQTKATKDLLSLTKAIWDGIVVKVSNYEWWHNENFGMLDCVDDNIDQNYNDFKSKTQNDVFFLVTMLYVM